MKGFRTAFAVLVAVVFLLILLGVAYGVFCWKNLDVRPYGSPWGGMPMGPGMFWGGGMWVFPLIGLVIFLFILYFAFTRGFGGSGPFCGWGGRYGGSSDPQSPMDILKMRYARGEISREEFERMKKDISET